MTVGYSGTPLPKKLGIKAGMSMAVLNAPNDLVIDAAGGVYFTDPPFRAPQPLPQPVQAVYYVNA